MFLVSFVTIIFCNELSFEEIVGRLGIIPSETNFEGKANSLGAKPSET
jgi:hypothetical protein